MPSRIVAQGRVVWHTPDWGRAHQWSRALPRAKDGSPVDCASGIPPDHPQSPFRAGVGLYCPEEGIAYRCVSAQTLNPLDGWAPTGFWQARWGVDHKAICSFVEYGFLDAAIEEGSQVRRYRCRDERRLKESAAWKKVQRRAAYTRWNNKRTRRRKTLTPDSWGGIR